MRKSFLAILLALLYGCQTAIYSPEAITSNDHTQGSVIYINRGVFKGSIWIQENKDSTWFFLSFNAISQPAKFLSEDFYIESDENIFKPIAPIRFTSGFGGESGNNSLEIHQGKIVVVEFPKEVQSLSSFVVHLPHIEIENNQEIADLDAIKFKRKSVSSGASEGAALLLVAIPIGVVTSPIWVPEMIIDKNNNTIKKGTTKDEIRKLLGDPKETYSCANSVSVWYYENKSYKGWRVLFFSPAGLLTAAKDYINQSDGCKQDAVMNLTSARTSQ